jgi:hypothetical protein
MAMMVEEPLPDDSNREVDGPILNEAQMCARKIFSSEKANSSTPTCRNNSGFEAAVFKRVELTTLNPFREYIRSGGVRQRWSDGVMEWWSGGVME